MEGDKRGVNEDFIGFSQSEMAVQEQGQRPTAQAILCGEILRLPGDELEKRINQELVKNIFLEDVGEDRGALPEPAWEEDGVFDDAAFVPRADHDDLQELDSQMVAAPAAIEVSPREQLLFFPLDTAETRIAHAILDALDHRGFLGLPLEEIAATQDEGVPEAVQRLGAVLERLQEHLEPAGMAARDLRECLLIQLRRQRRLHTLEAELLRDHWLLMQRFFSSTARGWGPLAREVKCSSEEAAAAVSRLRALDPAPGRVFTVAEVAYARAEFRVVLLDEGRWQIEPVPLRRRLQRREDASDLLAKVKSSGESAETLASYRQQLRQAENFLFAVNHRTTTLHRIAEAIMWKQAAFLTHGPTALRQLSMGEIAKTVGLHKSTVSRAVEGKYLETPFGVVPFRDLFSQSSDPVTGAEIEQAKVIAAIHQVVQTEDKSAPFTDEGIALAVKKLTGVFVARRTISKYRSHEQIPPRYLRLRNT